MRSLSLNNAHLNIPFLEHPGTLLDNDGNLTRPGSENNSATAKTELSDGTIVTITVKPTYIPGVDAPKQRQYTISITNASRDIVFDHGTFVNAEDNNYSEVVANQFTGVEVQAFRKERADETDRNTGEIIKVYPFQWMGFTQATSIRDKRNSAYTFDYNTVGDTSGNVYDPLTASPAEYHGNIRFKLLPGYNWALNTREGSTDFPTVEFREKQLLPRHPFGGSDILGPDGDGWYYITLQDPNPGSGTHIGLLTIQAQPVLYEIQYQDGIRKGAKLNENVGDLLVRNMPAYRQLDKDGHETEGFNTATDTNRGHYYSLVKGDGLYTSDRITISGAAPMTAGEHPATFEGWVLTDEDGNEIGAPGELIKPNDLVDLRKIAGGAAVNNAVEQNFTIYLTAKWFARESNFAYYTTFTYVDEAGAEVKRWGEPTDQAYPGGEDGQKYVALRQVYTTPSSTGGINVVFETDKSTTADKSRAEQWLEDNPWYKYDSKKNGSEDHEGEFFWENIRNDGEVDVWFISSLGQFTLHKTLAGGSDPKYSGEEVSFDVTFTLPGDDSDTAGNENAFFGTGPSYAASYTDEAGDSHPFSLTKGAGDNTYTGTFTLAVGDSAVFDLPGGTAYTIKERESILFEKTDPVSGKVAANTADEKTVTNTPTGIDIVKTQTIDDTEYSPEAGTQIVGTGEMIQYKITVTNRSASKTYHVKLTDPVPKADTEPGDTGHRDMRVLMSSLTADAELVDGEAVDGSEGSLQAGGTVEWDEFVLRSGEHKTLTFTGVAPVAQHEHEYANTAQADFWQEDVAGSSLQAISNTVSVIPAEDWLYIEKLVRPQGSALDEMFTFTVTLIPPTDGPTAGKLEDPYSYVGRVATGYEDLQTAPARGTLQQTGGKLSVTLKEGQAVTIYGLADGTGYKVEETKNGGFYTDSLIKSGKIDKNSQDWVRFTNLRPGQLDVTMKVSGDELPADEKSRGFPVTVSFTLPEGAENYLGTGPYTVMAGAREAGTLQRDGGTYAGSITMMDGDKVSFTLPAGTEYAVQEGSLDAINADIAPARYEMTKNGGNGTISSISTVDIENTYCKESSPEPPPGPGTGGSTGPGGTTDPDSTPAPDATPDPDSSPAPSGSPDPDSTPAPSGTPGPEPTPVQSPSPSGTAAPHTNRPTSPTWAPGGQTGGDPSAPKAPVTGDETAVMPYVLLLAASAAGLAALRRRRRRGN